MKLRTGEPWMPAATYGRSLRGLTVNLLVRDMAVSIAFQREVLAAEVLYFDPDFAAVRGYGSDWMLHADHTYANHPLAGAMAGVETRGAGVEIRLHGRDPDAAQAAAVRLGHPVLEPARDKPHGLREVYIVDPDGYVWVADVPAREGG